MELNKLVERVNAHLAGEMFSYKELEIHLDAVIDDINNRLNAQFPAFSEFNPTDFVDYPNYNFFPDKYLRTVVALGAAFYFYMTDEEGAESAVKYEQEYRKNLFYMERDYSNLVAEEFAVGAAGYIDTPEKEGIAKFYDDMF